MYVDSYWDGNTAWLPSEEFGGGNKQRKVGERGEEKSEWEGRGNQEEREGEINLEKRENYFSKIFSGNHFVPLTSSSPFHPRPVRLSLQYFCSLGFSSLPPFAAFLQTLYPSPLPLVFLIRVCLSAQKKRESEQVSLPISKTGILYIQSPLIN